MRGMMMDTLDEQIRARMAAYGEGYGEDVVEAAVNYSYALEAVLDLHAPEQHWTIGQDNKRKPSYVTCKQCRTTYPCDEVQAIAKQLSVGE